MFGPGNRANPNGRPKGRKSKVTPDIRAMAQKLFDEEYWRATKKRLREGKEVPAIHTLLLSYAFGKPKNDDEQKTTHITVGALSVLNELQPAAATQVLPVSQAENTSKVIDTVAVSARKAS